MGNLFGEFDPKSVRINIRTDHQYDATGNLFPMRTAAHEYGHYVNYSMWGSSAYSGANDNIKEPWAIFFSYATRHFAYRKGIATGGTHCPDLRSMTRDNLSLNSFATPRFNDFQYPFATYPDYARWSSYLWNLYDGVPPDGSSSYSYQASGTNFNTLTDNDDIAMPVRVFQVFNNLSTKTMANFHTVFKNGQSGIGALSTAEQNSVDAIYNNMMSTAASPPQMRSGNFATKSMNLNGNTLTVNLTYQPFNFPNNNSIVTRNSPMYFNISRQRFKDSPWISINSIAYNVGATTYGPVNYNVTNGNLYNYKLSVSQNGLESCYPHYLNYQNNNKPSYTFGIVHPWMVSPNQSYQTQFYVQNVNGLVSDVSDQYYYTWYANTEYGWEYLGYHYTHNFKPSIIFSSYTRYKSTNGGYGYIDLKCKGENYITGQQYEFTTVISCSGCQFAGRSPSAPQDSSDMGNKPVFLPEAMSDGDEGVDLFPNPVTDYLNVNIDGHNNYSFIKIFTAKGLEVKTVSPVNATNMINVSDLHAGNYILSLTGANTQKSFHFTRL